MYKSEIIGHIQEYLEVCRKLLCTWLDNNLNKKGDWWNNCVKKYLSDNQRTQIEKKNINSLSALDLSGLINVAIGNWNNLTRVLHDGGKAKKDLIDLKTVRNRYSHFNNSFLSKSAVSADLNTIRRIFADFYANSELIDDVRKFMLHIQNEKIESDEERISEQIAVGHEQVGINKRRKKSRREIKEDCRREGEIIFQNSNWTPELKFKRIRGGYEVTGFNVSPSRMLFSEIVIPSRYKGGLPVISIGVTAFFNCELTSVMIPDSITKIKGSAFYGNEGLGAVYYTGAQATWTKISIDPGNEDLICANIYFNWNGEQ